ncbi:MAG TPA: hypothetical protein VIQ31_15245 [Phormidium sp.]
MTKRSAKKVVTTARSSKRVQHSTSEDVDRMSGTFNNSTSGENNANPTLNKQKQSPRLNIEPKDDYTVNARKSVTRGNLKNDDKKQRVIPNRGPDLASQLLDDSQSSEEDDNEVTTFSTNTRANRKEDSSVEDMDDNDDLNNNHVSDDPLNASQKVASLNFDKFQNVDDEKETDEGLNMFLDDRPFSEISSVLKNSIYVVVEERLFPTSKFYVDDEDIDKIVGFVMNNVGLHGRSMKQKQARSKWWVTVRDYIKTRTNDCRQLVYDRWYIVGRRKFVSHNELLLHVLL